MAEPKGLVAVFTDEAGHVIATATDFDTSRPGGFKQIEAQRSRIGRSLAWKVIDAYSSPNLTRAIDEYQREQIIRNLTTAHKCNVKIIPVGYSDEEASIL